MCGGMPGYLGVCGKGPGLADGPIGCSVLDRISDLQRQLRAVNWLSATKDVVILIDRVEENSANLGQGSRVVRNAVRLDIAALD